MLVDKDVNLYPGSETDFSVRLTDASGSSLDASGYQVTWSAQYGTIDENGHYTAPTEERDDVVTAEVAGVSGTARVSVIGADHVQSIRSAGEIPWLWIRERSISSALPLMMQDSRAL